MQRTITKYFIERAFGFIQPDGGRTDVFLHKTAMAAGVVPAVDMVVEFVEEIGPNGRFASRERQADLTPGGPMSDGRFNDSSAVDGPKSARRQGKPVVAGGVKFLTPSEFGPHEWPRYERV